MTRMIGDMKDGEKIVQIDKGTFVKFTKKEDIKDGALIKIEGETPVWGDLTTKDEMIDVALDVLVKLRDDLPGSKKQILEKEVV